MYYRYSKLQGSEGLLNFNPEKAVDAFIDNLLESNNVAEALSRLLREGVEELDNELKGIDKLMDELRRLKDEIFHRYNIATAREDLIKRLEELIKKHLGAGESRRLKKEFLKNLRQDEYIKKIVENLTENRISPPSPLTPQEIANFQESLMRYALRFSGKERVSFEKALEIFKKLKDIEDIERGLRSEDLDAIDPVIMKQILGGESAESLNTLRHIVQQIESMGYIKTREGNIELTPEGIRRIGEKALRDIFSRLDKEKFGTHELTRTGNGDTLTGGTRQYRFGDEFNVDIIGTIKNAIRRGYSGGKKTRISYEDFEIYEKESNTRLSTVLLIDMSWSMSWGNKFTAAKKVGIALEELIRTRFPQDRLYVVGFFTVAVELKPYQLPTLDLNLNDPFTNMQDAFLLADRLLMRESTSNRYVILITDGQPTAYFESGILQVEWPVFGISPRSFEKTLEAVHLLTRHNIRINTFMLDSNPVLVQFVEEMMRINHGRAFFTTPEEIGSYLFVDYLERKRSFIN